MLYCTYSIRKPSDFKLNEKRASLKPQADIQQVELILSTVPTGLTEVCLRLRPTFSTKLDHVRKYIPPKNLKLPMCY